MKHNQRGNNGGNRRVIVGVVVVFCLLAYFAFRTPLRSTPDQQEQQSCVVTQLQQPPPPPPSPPTPLPPPTSFPSSIFPAQYGFKKIHMLDTDIMAGDSTHMIRWVTTSQGEIQVTRVFNDLVGQCLSSETPRVILDVGANTGMYGIASARRGCKVHLFEPQPLCMKFIRASMMLSEVENRAFLEPFPLSDAVRSFKMDADGCEGDKAISDAAPNQQHVNSSTLDIFLRERGIDSVLLMKVDTEGHETSVFEGGMQSIAEGKIENIVVELSPAYWPRTGLSRESAAEVMKEVFVKGKYEAEVLVGRRVITDAEAFYDYVLKEHFDQADVWLRKRDPTHV